MKQAEGEDASVEAGAVPTAGEAAEGEEAAGE
jgi:hypothetical protein